MPFALDLPGPSRRVRVEPLRLPVPLEEPAPGMAPPAPPEPAPAPPERAPAEPEPART